jgi:4-hydroxybenzoate polyprenyltransferase
VGFTVSLTTAAWLGRDLFLVALLGVAAGISYDLALKGTPVAVLAWWAGFSAVPLVAMVISGQLRGALEAALLAGLLALAMQIANGLPDAAGDRLGGVRTLPSTLGDVGSRVVMGATLLAAAALVLALRARLHQDDLALVAAAVVAGSASLALLPRGAPRIAFPLLAVCAAVATVSWLAALPVQPPS